MSASIESRLRIQEAKTALLQRELARAVQRLAAPQASRLGRHLVELTEVLLPLQEADATIKVWSRGALRDGGTITIRDLQLGDDESFPVGTKLWAVWDKTTWTWLSRWQADDLGVPFINLSGMTIPPGGIMDWFGDINIGGIPHVKCYQPAYIINRRWLVNGTTPVVQGETSLGSWLGDLSGMAAVDSGSISNLNDLVDSGWGPRPGSFLLYPDLHGFTQVGSNAFLVSGTWNIHFRQAEAKHLKVLLTDTLERNSFTLGQVLYRANGVLTLSPFNSPLLVKDGFYLRVGESIEATPSSPIVADIEWLGSFWEITNAQCPPVGGIGGGSGSSNTPGFGQMTLTQAAPPSIPASPSFS